MRQKGRDRERERDLHQWIRVQRKKKSSRPAMTTRTCFVDSLPTNIQTHELENFFKPYGDITNILITNHLRHNSKFHYAFVKFASPTTLHKVIRSGHGKLLGKNRIRVFPAKHDTHPPNLNKKPQHPRAYTKIRAPKPSQAQTQHLRYRPLRYHRSYKEACQNTLHAGNTTLDKEP